VCELDFPVLTGIGHERDNTLLDEVANIRFDTPSKVIAGIEQVIAKRVAQAKISFEAVTRLALRMTQATGRLAALADAEVRAGALRNLSLANEHSARMLAEVRVGALKSVRDASDQYRDSFFQVRQQALTQLAEVRQSVPAMLAEVRSEARQMIRTTHTQTDTEVSSVLERSAWRARQARDDITAELQKVALASTRIVSDATAGAQALMREIAGQGPQKTLGRGFAIVRKADGSTLTSAGDAPGKGAIEIQFHDGKVAARTADEQWGEHP
jgi:exodeoxyribonuclease VII large subunit